VAKYNTAQIAALAHIGGFTGKEQIVTATAIALAESGGDQNATHKNKNGSTDKGLWQINDKAHPDKIALATSSAIGNAQAAYKVWAEKHSFTPWATFNSKSYLAHMPAAESAYAELQDDPTIETKLKAGGGAVDSQFGDVNPGSPADGVGGALTNGFNILNKGIFGVAVNAGVFLLAIVLLILGVILLARKPIGAGIRTVSGVKRKGVAAIL
jgi:hypothetical protein